MSAFLRRLTGAECQAQAQSPNLREAPKANI